MKKSFLTTLLTLIITSLLTVFYCQDTSVNYKNRILIEGQILNFNQDIYRPKIKIRYNLNNKSALRINTNFNRSVNYQEIYEVNGPGVGSVEKIYSMYLFLWVMNHKKMEKLCYILWFRGCFGVWKK